MNDAVAIWSAFIFIGIVVLLSVIVMILSGCQGSAAPEIKPSAKITPTITAGDGAEILTKISQVQKTVSTITNNFGLDSERRKLEEARGRKSEKTRSAAGILVAGFILMALLIKAPVNPLYSAVIFFAAIGCIVGSYLLPLIWIA